MSALVERQERSRAYHVGNVRTTLLDEARTLLREGGLAHLNLRALSSRTGVALGTVYHYFGSKADLLAALAAQGFAELRAILETQVEKGDPRVVRACVVAYFEFAWSEPTLYSLMFDPRVARSEPVKDAREQAFAAFESAIGSAPAANGLAAEVLHSISVAVWTCAHGAASLAPIQDEGQALVEAMITGLEALFRVGREYRAYPNNVQEG